MSIALKSIDLRNLLSFGPDGICPDEEGGALELRPLNIVIGPNGSGKSNLIDSISLLQAAARGSLAEIIAGGGGVGEWIWKGAPKRTPARIEVIVPYPDGETVKGSNSLRYWLAFGYRGDKEVGIAEEYLENAQQGKGHTGYPYNRYLEFTPLDGKEGSLRINSWIEEDENNILHQARRWTIAKGESLQQPGLSKVSAACPEADFVRQQFDLIRLYREWSVGRTSLVREPQEISSSNDHTALREDALNLTALLSRVNATEGVRVRSYLRKFYGEDAKDWDIEPDDRSLSLVLEERDFRTPAKRMSDGTLRWFALLAVLLPRSVPSLICLEEPEIGLHPDMIPVLATLLKDASQHTQIIVTTHSDILVDAFTDEPENVVVCEKKEGATRMRRLVRNDLSGSLKDYSLAELWSTGQIGGNRI